MNDKIRIPNSLIHGSGGDYYIYNRADLEALLSEQEPQRLVKGAVCRFTQSNGDVVYYDKLTNKTVLISTHAEPLDWETLGYTLAQNYSEAQWFAVDKDLFLWLYQEEPEKAVDAWNGLSAIAYAKVTLTIGVEWHTTKRRIKRI